MLEIKKMLISTINEYKNLNNLMLDIFIKAIDAVDENNLENIEYLSEITQFLMDSSENNSKFVKKLSDENF